MLTSQTGAQEQSESSEKCLHVNLAQEHRNRAKGYEKCLHVKLTNWSAGTEQKALRKLEHSNRAKGSENCLHVKFANWSTATDRKF